MKRFCILIVGLLLLPILLTAQASSCSLMGDVNGSGSVDIVDALVVAQAYVGLNPANYNAECADANCSGSVDIVDALLIAQYYVGLISSFPCQATPAPTPSGSISIACGSSSAVGSFQADQYFSGGSTYNNTNTIDVTGITDNPPPAALFNNERYGAISYTIPGFAPGGTYAVTLYFAETYLTTSGGRVFNVAINGTTVLSNFDIYTAAGGQNKATAQAFTTTADGNGQIGIQFTSITENPKVNGISIQSGTAPTAGPTAVTTPAPTAGGTAKVMPLGDSITDGYSTAGGYRIKLWSNIQGIGKTVDFVGSLSNGPAELTDKNHEGHSGWRIDQLDTNINTWMDTYQPRIVLLHIGTNDITQNYDLANAPNRVGGLVDKICAKLPAGGKVYVAKVVPISYASGDQAAVSFNNQVATVVQTRQSAGKPVYIVDMHSALTTSDLADQVHPNRTGYDKMADVWFAAIRNDL
jgi:lysophospholipase L1-like esterase